MQLLEPWPIRSICENSAADSTKGPRLIHGFPLQRQGDYHVGLPSRSDDGASTANTTTGTTVQGSVIH